MRASFSTSTAGALLASGIADALSAGVLLFVCLADLLPPMMTDSEWLRSQSTALQVGVAVMRVGWRCGGGPRLARAASRHEMPALDCQASLLFADTPFPFKPFVQALAFAAFYSGAAVMALIGKWL